MHFRQGTQWPAFAGVTAVMTLTTIMTALLITHKVQDPVSAISQLSPKYRGVLMQNPVVQVSKIVNVQDFAEVVQGLDHTIGAGAPSRQVEKPESKVDILLSLATVIRLSSITFPVNEIREAMNLYGLL